MPLSFIDIGRTWKNGDVIEVRYPMHLYLIKAKDNQSVAAVMYGTLTLAGAMGTEGMKSPAPFSNPLLYNDYYTYDYNIPFAGESLTFETTDGKVRFKPLHQIHRERYIVYWNLSKNIKIK
jgi:hypothetical protein